MLIKPRHFLLIGALLRAQLTYAQVPVTANPNHEALLASSDPKLAANKRLVYDFWRSIIDARRMDGIEKYLAESYIQHNPTVPTGRAGFVSHFASEVEDRPIQSRVTFPIVSIVAEGDMVVMAFISERKDPKEPTKKYTTTWFDMFRIEGGKIAEHWDVQAR